MIEITTYTKLIWGYFCWLVHVYLNGNNAAEGENNIKYASSYPMNWTVKNWFVQDFKGHGHDTDEWRDYNEDNVPFERLEKVYVSNEDSLEQRMNIFHGQLYSVYRDNRKFRLPLQLFFLIKSRSDS